MIRITIDVNLVDKLPGVKQPVEICDESGQVLGQYYPACRHLLEEPLISEEELDQREQEAESFTTVEMIAHLEAL
jgi:hypothetical protein